MKILHIWNQAGTATIMAKYQRQLGHIADVIQNSKHDNVGFGKVYDCKLVTGKYNFCIQSLLDARKYDVIHLHDSWFMVIPLRVLYPRKKIIMHYHGSMVRESMKESRRKIWEKFVDKILVSTPDLLEIGIKYYLKPEYIPNPIDTDLFYPCTPPLNGKCFAVLKKGMDGEALKNLLREKGFNLDFDFIQPKLRYVGSIPYLQMPAKLVQYEYMADISIYDGVQAYAYSTVGLQGLAMGLKVINFNFMVETKLPEWHKPENVAQKLIDIYNKTLTGEKE